MAFAISAAPVIVQSHGFVCIIEKNSPLRNLRGSTVVEGFVIRGGVVFAGGTIQALSAEGLLTQIGRNFLPRRGLAADLGTCH